MNNFDIFDNYSDAVCIFDNAGNILFKNKMFINSFIDCSSFKQFKKRFNFNMYYLLSTENIENETPINLLLKSKENFHTVCTYQNVNDEYIYYYIYSFRYFDNIVVIFKDYTAIDRYKTYEKNYNKILEQYNQAKSQIDKFTKLQEQAQVQVLKMAIINRISLVIRETNDIETVLSSALREINDLLGSFKTYFSVKNKTAFKPVYIVNNDKLRDDFICEYEPDVVDKIKNKEISVKVCLKECLNIEESLIKSSNRIIIPVYNKNKLLGIIVTFTNQKVIIEDNIEILQSIAVQLASSIIQSGLIQQLNKKNKKLQKTLAELKNAQMQLINSEKMAAIGQLASGVAHEINTPLASISSNNKLICKILASLSASDTEQLEVLKELNSIDIEAASRISDIVKSLTRFVRLDQAEFQEADINSELDLTLKLITHITKNNISVKRCYGNVPHVMCSVNMMNQVFMNLLVNACHSIKEKGIDGEITITTEQSDNNLLVKIKDNGVGIPQEIQNKIFSVGFTTKKPGVGTGIGLSISKKIVERHKGTITFTSKQGVGSEFIVSVPLTNS